MSSENDLMHHDRVDPFHYALVLDKAEQLLHHQHDDVELVLVILQTKRKKKIQIMTLYRILQEKVTFGGCLIYLLDYSHMIEREPDRGFRHIVHVMHIF